MIPYDPKAYDLMHEGAIALSRVESNGMRVDLEYVQRARIKARRQIAGIKRELMKSDVVKVWRDTYGPKMKITSDTQIGKVLYDVMGFKRPDIQTDSGKHKVDERTLALIDHPFIKPYLRMKKLHKLDRTYFNGLLQEQVDGFIYCFFHLHTVQTFRGSSSEVNYQNFPIRNPIQSRPIRRSFLARKGRRILEIDFKGIEVNVAACYHKDPVMIEYITDPSKDMHRDMAMELYRLPQEEITKEIRHCGKNMFVFPQFYGDYYIDCARHLWRAVDELQLKTVSGMMLRDHLKAEGLKKLGELDPKQRPEPGTFERHIHGVEHNFWNKRFKVYRDWKEEWYEKYLKQGWFKSHTGFVCQGAMRKNQVINFPVQGSAFHCLLRVLTWLVNTEMVKRNMKSLVVGQIHDSLVIDAVPEEVDDLVDLVRRLVDRLRKHWDWLIVPMTVEVEIAPVGGTWADKEAIK